MTRLFTGFAVLLVPTVPGGPAVSPLATPPVAAKAEPLNPPDPAPAKPAPLPHRARLVKTLSQETLAESIELLPAWDDTLWVRGDMFPGRLVPPESSGERFGEDSYKYLSIYIPNLNRVRKVVEEGAKKTDSAVPLLKKLLAESVEGFEAARKAHLEAEAKRDPTKPVAIEQPDDYYRCRIAAPAAAYLLAELRAYESLPAMLKAYHAKGRLPMSRVFLYHAMHLLAAEHPPDKLSPAARKALEEYREAAKGLPAAKTVEAPSWRAEYDERDFRVVIGKEDLGLDRQPKVRLRRYPPDLDPLDAWEGRPQQKSTVDLQALCRKLEAFVKLAYPE